MYDLADPADPYWQGAFCSSHLDSSYLLSVRSLVKPSSPTASQAHAPLRAPAATFNARASTARSEYVPTSLLHDGRWSKVLRVRTANSPPTDAGAYALKVPTDDHQRASAASNMLRHEARILRRVSQQNLIALLDCRLSDEQTWLLTPHLEGATLRHVLDAGLRCPVSYALWLARQVAQALAALHEQGWRHGDIRPANIHVSPSGHATLLDLGLARPLDSRTPAKGGFAGTLTYAAPETLTDNTRADHRSDLYSLGAVLFHAIAGHPPFLSPNAASLAQAHLQQTPPELPLEACSAATDIRQLVARLLAKDPLRRPQSAAELAQRLMRLEIATMHQRVAV